jgi:hypothetical protein
MATRRVWVVEEILADNREIAQRQTVGSYDLQPDDSWAWIRPNERLDTDQQTEWDRVMDALRDVNGEDLRHIVCFAGLLDHCLSPANIENYEP